MMVIAVICSILVCVLVGPVSAIAIVIVITNIIMIITIAIIGSILIFAELPIIMI